MKDPIVRMSSSIHGTNIKVNASEEETRSTIAGAYCPLGTVQENPIVAIATLLILTNEGRLVGNNQRGGA